MLVNDIMNHSALILLVEDDRSMLDGMYDLLQMPSLLQTVGIEYDLEVLTASNGQEALDIMSQLAPDLIVSDIMMPVLDGYQLLHAVQTNPDWFHIPFIFLTAKGNKKEILEGQLKGANLYITKPFASTELLELIKSQLDKSFQHLNTHQQHVAGLKKGILQILNHEFRTPLTYVTAYYEMLANTLTHFPNNEDFQEHLRGIQAGCVRLTRLIEDFILVIELETGEFKAAFQEHVKPVSAINQLVQAAIQEQAPQATEKEIMINFTPMPDSPIVYGNESSLQDIFGRLLSNAIKFTPSAPEAGKQINIATTTLGNEVHIILQDEGLGFPSALESQIFELFFQYNRDLLEQQGAGTGLTIAKGLVDLHNGRIEVTSEEGAGSIFTVVLPIYTGIPDQPTPPADNLPQRKKATILLVEDEESLLVGLKELLAISLGPYQLEALTASNGQQGLEILREQRPDLIVSDIMMPVMDGYEFLRNVRQNPDLAQIPFIFLTAKGERRDIHRGLRSGAEMYIPKPYDSDELVQLITVQLDHHSQLQGVMSQNLDTLKRSILNLITPDFLLPLSAVQEYSEALAVDLTDIQSDAELKDSLHGIRDGSIRLTHLVEDFISLAELRTGEAETAHSLRKQPIYHPGVLLHEASQMCAPVAEAANTQLHCNIQPSLPPIFGDGKTLLDSIRRLLEISIKSYSGDEKQTIFLAAVQEADDICFSIELPPDLHDNNLANIFSILTETEDDLDLSKDPDTTPTARIAKGYVDLNNGRILIKKDTNANHHIIISLPVYTPEEAAP